MNTKFIQSHNGSKHTGAFWIALCFLAVNLSLLTWYLFVGYQAGFHSDAASKVLLAREIMTSGQYFPTEWNYVNKDLFVFFGHTFIVPLLVFLPAGYLVHAISGLISSCLVLLGVWLISGLTSASATRRVLVVGVVAAGISGFLAENLFGQASYGAAFYYSAFIVFFSCQFLREKSDKKRWIGVVLLVIIWLVFWANPQRAMIYYGLPLLSAIAWLRFLATAEIVELTKPSVRSLLWIVGVGMTLGVVCHSIVLAGVNSVAGAGSAQWLPAELMIRNAGYIIKGFLAIFGGLPRTGGIVLSLAGMYEALRFVSALSLAVLMVIALRRAMTALSGGLVFLAVFTFTAFLAVLFFQVATSIPDMTDPIQSSRYLVPQLLLLTILALTQPVSLRSAPVAALTVVFVGLSLITSGFTTFVKSSNSSNLDWGMPGLRNNQLKGLGEFLVKNGLRYGFASYWNAGVVSVISDEKVLVRQIVFAQKLPMPMHHLSSERWYRSEAWTGESFLLLTKPESDQIDFDLLAAYHGKPTRELAYENFRIIVYSDNVARGLPGWDTHFDQPVTFIASKVALTQSGRFVENYVGGGGALVAEKGQSGALHFGPYVNVQPGTYSATFNVVAPDNPNGSVRLDVAGAPDSKIFAEATLKGVSAPYRLSFTISELRKMEFRVWSLGTEQVAFRGVTLEKQAREIKKL